MGMAKEEIFLRDLFLLKYKLAKKTNGNSLNNSYYLVPRVDSSTPDGRKFLEALGVKIVRFDSYQDIYNHSLWK